MIRDQIGQGLGFSIAGGKGSSPFKDGSDGIFISRVTEGGLAHRDGKILVGDKVLVVCVASTSCEISYSMMHKLCRTMNALNLQIVFSFYVDKWR